MRFREIEIDFDIHKLIEAERKNFDETPNDVLRRLLKLGGDSVGVKEVDQTGTRKPWRKGSVTLPHGTLLQATYNSVTCHAQIDDGKWVNEDGSEHTSPSSAMDAFARTKSGAKTALNGKIYWFLKLPEANRWILYKDFEQSRT